MPQTKKNPLASPGVPRKDAISLIEDAYRKIKRLIYNRQLISGQRLLYDDLATLDINRLVWNHAQIGAHSAESHPWSE